QAARERAQLALAQLQDSHGYDLWWVGQRDVLERRAWHVLFPLLALSALALLVLLPFVPQAFFLLILLVFATIVVRYGTDRRVLTEAAAFRQIAPIVATGEALRFLDGDAIAPIVAPFRTDTPSLSRLKTIARWVSGDPFMLSVRPGAMPMLASSFISIV